MWMNLLPTGMHERCLENDIYYKIGHRIIYGKEKKHDYFSYDLLSYSTSCHLLIVPSWKYSKKIKNMPMTLSFGGFGTRTFTLVISTLQR